MPLFSYSSCEQHIPDPTRVYLDVGGGTSGRWYPAYYSHLRRVCLDVDPEVKPEICLDARLLRWQEPEQYEAIFCSHNLEHYDPDDVDVVLQGFLNVLKPDGFVEILVPNISRICDIMIQSNQDLNDLFYHSGRGPVYFRDTLYGFAQEIADSGQSFYAHKTGFSPVTLRQTLLQNGFCLVVISCPDIDIRALAFKNPPTDYHQKLLNFYV